MQILIKVPCHGDTEGGFDFKVGDKPVVSERLGNMIIAFGYAEKIEPENPKAKSVNPAE